MSRIEPLGLGSRCSVPRIAGTWSPGVKEGRGATFGCTKPPPSARSNASGIWRIQRWPPAGGPIAAPRSFYAHIWQELRAEARARGGRLGTTYGRAEGQGSGSGESIFSRNFRLDRILSLSLSTSPVRPPYRGPSSRVPTIDGARVLRSVGWLGGGGGRDNSLEHLVRVWLGRAHEAARTSPKERDSRRLRWCIDVPVPFVASHPHPSPVGAPCSSSLGPRRSQLRASSSAAFPSAPATFDRARRQNRTSGASPVCRQLHARQLRCQGSAALLF
jgi:hypothetical protein